MKWTGEVASLTLRGAGLHVDSKIGVARFYKEEGGWGKEEALAIVTNNRFQTNMASLCHTSSPCPAITLSEVTKE